MDGDTRHGSPKAGRSLGIPPLRIERARMGDTSSVYWPRFYCLILGFTTE